MNICVNNNTFLMVIVQIMLFDGRLMISVSVHHTYHTTLQRSQKATSVLLSASERGFN